MKYCILPCLSISSFFFSGTKTYAHTYKRDTKEEERKGKERRGEQSKAEQNTDIIF